MNSHQTSSAAALRGLPSARVLALMAMHLQAPEPRADLRVVDGLETRADAAGPGWFESSFELERGLQVVEDVVVGLDDEWAGFAFSCV